MDGRLRGLGLGARPPVRLLRPRGRGGGHARWSSGAREARRGRGLRRSKGGSKRSDASLGCSHPWRCIRRSRGRCEAREVQGKTEEQQQGISPAAEGVLCSGEVELRRGTRRRRDPGEALVGRESSRESLDRGHGHLDRGGAVGSAGWMDRAGGTVVGSGWIPREQWRRR